MSHSWKPNLKSPKTRSVLRRSHFRHSSAQRDDKWEIYTGRHREQSAAGWEAAVRDSKLADWICTWAMMHKKNMHANWKKTGNAANRTVPSAALFLTRRPRPWAGYITEKPRVISPTHHGANIQLFLTLSERTNEDSCQTDAGLKDIWSQRVLNGPQTFTLASLAVLTNVITSCGSHGRKTSRPSSPFHAHGPVCWDALKDCGRKSN